MSLRTCQPKSIQGHDKGGTYKNKTGFPAFTPFVLPMVDLARIFVLLMLEEQRCDVGYGTRCEWGRTQYLKTGLNEIDAETRGRSCNIEWLIHEAKPG